MGIMEKKMDTTTMGYINIRVILGIMENQMEAAKMGIIYGYII